MAKIATLVQSHKSRDQKAQYRVTNWQEYNKSLVNRGSITFWFDEDLQENWYYDGPDQRGGQFKYSNVCMVGLLQLKAVFRLQYRQLEGFVNSLVMTMGLDLEVPCYTQMNRRAQQVDVQLCLPQTQGPLHIVFDSTGLKVYGDGAWKVRKHGISKRRTWRKLHLGVDEQTGMIHPDQLFNVAITRRRPLFAMQFAYEPNGNIGEMKWKVTAHDVKYYLNDYDPLNRLLGSSYGVEREVQSGTALPFVERIGTQEYDEFGISYDPIGNIKTLSRRGLIPSGNCFTPGLIDQLTYHYGDAEGRLSGVTDAAPEPFRPHGFKPAAGGTAHYQYDHNGNLMSDAHKSIQFSYNHLNLPLSISTPQGTLHFLYDATGRKWAKSGPDGIRFYAGNIEYLDGKVQHIAFADGRLVAEYDENGTFQGTYRAEYFRTDHLGNTRLTFSDFNHDMVISPRISSGTPTAYDSEITSENHYYPFGLGHTGPWYERVMPENRYLYNGKELMPDFGLNWYAYGYRHYDMTLGRFTGVDPIAEEFAHVSVYNYAENEPVGSIDLHGLQKLKVNNSYRESAVPAWMRNSATAGAALLYPNAAFKVGQVEYGGTNISSVAGRIARHAAKNDNLSVGEGSERNALRHAIWSAMINQEFGSIIANTLTNAHEGIGVLEDATVHMHQPHEGDLLLADEIVDFLNNEIGRSLTVEGGALSTKEIALKAITVFNREGLYTATVRENGAINIQRTKITDKQRINAIIELMQVNKNGFSPEEQKKLNHERKQ